jgi:DNA-binding transcriptional ArsR family regulator
MHILSSALHSLKIKVEIKERRKQVASLLSKAATEGEIAYKLGVNQSTISRDIGVLKEESQKHVYELAKESLAFFYTQSLDGINEAKRESWKIYNDEKTPTRERLLALKIIMQADETRFRLLSEGPSVLAFKTLQERLDKIESR